LKATDKRFLVLTSKGAAQLLSHYNINGHELIVFEEYKSIIANRDVHYDETLFVFDINEPNSNTILEQYLSFEDFGGIIGLSGKELSV